MKKTFIIPVFLLFNTAAFCQIRLRSYTADTLKFNNRLYKQELGIDIQGIFAGYVGSNLVWKLRDDRSKLIPVSYANFWRFQAGLYGGTFTGYKDSLVAGNKQIQNTYPPSSNNQIWLMVGRERNNFYNRFNFYYGWDAGPSFQYSRNNSYINGVFFDNPGQVTGGVTVPVATKDLSIGVRANAFVGVKYHLTDRISVSFESGLGLAYSWTHHKMEATSNNILLGSSTDAYHSFSYGFDYVRLVTLNYHFKQY